jgi:hypothetical protein
MTSALWILTTIAVVLLLATPIGVLVWIEVSARRRRRGKEAK